MKLAKPLKAGGSPLLIETGSALLRGRMVKPRLALLISLWRDFQQLCRSVDREALRAARNLACSPKQNKPRKKVVDVEGERVTCLEASIVVRVKGECTMVPPGSVAVARVYRTCINLGDLYASFIEGRFDQLTEGGSRSMQESDSSIVVRDGRADYTAKGWALMQFNEENPCVREKNVLVNGVPTAHCKYLETASCYGSGVNEEPCARKPHAGICEGAAL